MLAFNGKILEKSFPAGMLNALNLLTQRSLVGGIQNERKDETVPGIQEKPVQLCSPPRHYGN